MSGLTSVGYFLFSVIFGLVIAALWLRIAIRFFRISAINPFCQLIFRVTNPVVDPVSKLFRIKALPGGRYDVIAFLILIVAEAIKIICLSYFAFGKLMPLVYVVLYILADLVIQPCDLLFYAIIFRVIMSFANPNWQHPITQVLRTITEPALVLGRRLVPDISGFDFSPYIMLIILTVVTLFIRGSLPVKIL